MHYHSISSIFAVKSTLVTNHLPNWKETNTIIKDLYCFRSVTTFLQNYANTIASNVLCTCVLGNKGCHQNINRLRLLRTAYCAIDWKRAQKGKKTEEFCF